jgi:hypothetical protein
MQRLWSCNQQLAAWLNVGTEEREELVMQHPRERGSRSDFPFLAGIYRCQIAR